MSRENTKLTPEEFDALLRKALEEDDRKGDCSAKVPELDPDFLKFIQDL